jgi:hypothetical protein
MLVRRRPLIMVSSSIGGMEAMRRRVAHAIESLHLADSWMFEFNSVAAGSSPDAQYLQAARDCDVFVVLVGDVVRAGTIDEYDEAVRDNPHKVLPFFLGPDSCPSGEFRRLVSGRHTYKRVENQEELPQVVAGSVQEFVASGRIVQPSLRAAFVQRRDVLRAFVGLPPGFAFVRALDAPSSGTSVRDLLSTARENSMPAAVARSRRSRTQRTAEGLGSQPVPAQRSSYARGSNA